MSCHYNCEEPLLKIVCPLATDVEPGRASLVGCLVYKCSWAICMMLAYRVQRKFNKIGQLAKNLLKKRDLTSRFAQGKGQKSFNLYKLHKWICGRLAIVPEARSSYNWP